jgi:hypothetical protein
MWAQLAHKFHSCIWAWVDLGDSPVAHRAANLVDRLTSKKKNLVDSEMTVRTAAAAELMVIRHRDSTIYSFPGRWRSPSSL